MAKQRIKQVVTRDTLKKMLNNPNRKYVEAVVGRALVALLKRQTDDEQRTNDCNVPVRSLPSERSRGPLGRMRPLTRRSSGMSARS